MPEQDRSDLSRMQLYGALQREFGQINQAIRDSREQFTHRQDDMRQEMRWNFRRIDQRIDTLQKPASSWLKLVPWDRVAFAALSMGATLGWIKPAWVKLLTGG